MSKICCDPLAYIWVMLQKVDEVSVASRTAVVHPSVNGFIDLCKT